MSRPTNRIYKFGPFSLDTKERLLLRDSESIPLTLKSFKTLVLLVENSGHVVERTELLDYVWPNTFVEEANLTQQVFTLRKILGTDQTGHQYIETVPKLGYRFAASVSKVQNAIGDLEEETEAQPRIITKDTLIDPDKRTDTLPLVNVGTGPDSDYVSNGIAENIASKLSRLTLLHVRAQSSVCRYEGREIDVQKIGPELDLQALVTGRILKLGDSLIFRIELVDVTDWSENETSS